MTQRNYDHDVEQIRTALHSGRASVMVGTGFSFNAQKRYSSARGFPSWSDLTESLVEHLYPSDKKARSRALKNAGATSGALRLAQEFEAAFGRTVLLNHLREVLPDREHEPGPLHKDLLNLPWADVFTTNYDTLLERAARPLRERRYQIVRCLSDLPLKRTPRIVKLHGTLPELKDCILTEEDYRNYPERFGPFVAEVQVAMVESHLCLVGFSGDDPNFLAWSGWVRDRMGKHTLPIYLWTFDEPTSEGNQVRRDARQEVAVPW
ncbi:MAG: SIR2 family NAD-dependent protein deacylase [Thermoguttaceae bacterium]